MKLRRMKTKILAAVFAVGILWACKKNAYNTKPTIKIKSINTNVVEVNGSLRIQLEVSDKEGDVTNTLFMQKVRVNLRTTPTLRDTLYLPIPDAPNSQDGTVDLNLSYNDYLTSAINPNGQNDTLLLKFALKDKANNVSDTLTTDRIVIIR